MKKQTTASHYALGLKTIAAWNVREFRANQASTTIVASVPKLQRGLVWSPSQIELLWDSLLRGFPVGSFVVCDRIQGQDDGEDHSVTHHLLDGQQRANAIAHGYADPFSENSASSDIKNESLLWIDLNPSIPPNSTREFLLRFTTSAHPWGFRKTDLCQPLRASQIREILHSLALVPSASSYRRPKPVELFPGDANCPIPLAWLTQHDELPEEELWNRVAQRCHELKTSWARAAATLLSQPSDVECHRLHQLYEAICALQRQTVVALMAPESLVNAARNESHQDTDSNDNTSIEHLFHRLNRQGTKLEGEELAYSMIKAYWPEVAKPIEDIVSSRMPASRMVMLACRAALTSDERIRGVLSVSDVRRLAASKSKDAEKVLDYIKNHLCSCCQWIENVLLYHKTQNPNGILPVHLANIARTKPDVYLLLQLMADRLKINEENAPFDPSLRQALLALTLRLSWFAIDPSKAIAHVYASCRNEVSGDTVNKAIRDAIEHQWLIELPSPIKLSCVLDLDHTDLENWSWQTPITGDGIEPGVKMRQAYWNPIFSRWNNRDILLYAQRHFMAQKFPDFDPSRRDLWEGHNRPWDFDHIHPSYYVYDVRKNNRYQRFVKQWLDQIGNLRAWPFEENRSDSKELACEKILTEQQREDSFILQAEIDAFSTGKNALSDETSARAFSSACRDRTIRIYEQSWKVISL
jgi:hypothetical protein